MSKVRSWRSEYSSERAPPLRLDGPGCRDRVGCVLVAMLTDTQFPGFLDKAAQALTRAENSAEQYFEQAKSRVGVRQAA